MLEHLDPKPVWNYFEGFCAIPHPSGYEQRAADFVVNAAAQLGFAALTDAAGNVLIRKPSHPEGKNRSPVVLQSHLDMVPQKNDATTHDFRTDPLQLMINDEWVKARGTTLGADNGIGVALALAVLADSTIQHGPVEALFTIDEERGMTGAFGLAPDFLTGRKMINLDTENEEEICIGCAGGTDIIATLPAIREPVAHGAIAFSLAAKGLRGGHSGMEIHLRRSNALKLMTRILTAAAEQFDVRLDAIQGGSARNAIPREAFATVTVPREQAEAFSLLITELGNTIAGELTPTDAGFTITVSETGVPEMVLIPASQKALLSALDECPYGVLRMSEHMEGAVETSNNLSTISTAPDGFRIECMLRSSSESQMKRYRESITAIFTGRDAQVSYGSTFPGWQPDPDARLLSIMKETHAAVYRKEPEVVAVHAGLECGIIGARFPGMEMVSCGPTIRYAHSPDEQMHIPSVERFWRWLVAALERV